MARSKAEFQAFYQRYGGALHAYFRRLGVSQSEQIADLVQESFVESYRSWQSLKSDDAALAWLYTIARRQMGRSIHKNRLISLNETADAALSHRASHSSNQEKHLESQQLCQIILKHLALTSQESKRQVLVAYYLEEKSFKEIEIESGITLSTLTTWCSRFRQECLKKIGAMQQKESQSYLKILPALKKGERP